MGHSATGRYGDGRDVHGLAAAWPPRVLERWRDVVATVLAAPPRTRAAAATENGAPVAMERILRDSDAARRLHGLARRHGLDEADVAHLWSRGGGESAAAWGAATVADVEKRLRAAVRLPAATRTHVRAQLVEAVARLPASARRARPATFLASEAGRRLVAAALGPRARSREAAWSTGPNGP
jgi:hypothetical protein